MSKLKELNQNLEVLESQMLKHFRSTKAYIREVGSMTGKIMSQLKTYTKIQRRTKPPPAKKLREMPPVQLRG